MRKLMMISLALGTILVGGMMTAQIGFAQGTTTPPAGYTEQLTGITLKPLLEGLGYTMKQINEEAGKEKYEIKLERNGFNIPIGVEISPSTRLIWLTVSLGKPTTIKSEALLKANASTQPSFFYITNSGYLMMALPLENRQMKPEILRWAIDKLSNDVSSQAPNWQSQ